LGISHTSLTATDALHSHIKYRPDIDGLRAVAVLSVVIFHAFPDLVRGGFTGVDVFFVISGFLISTIIFEGLDRETFSFLDFYTRRIRRIFPAVLLVLSASYAFGWFALLPDEYAQLGKHIAAGAGFVSNLVLWGEVGYFDNSAETKPLLHLWSLGVEEQFYIVWPALIWIAWRRKRVLPFIMLLLLTSFLLSIKGVRQDPLAAFYSPHTRFWELLAGSLLAWFTFKKANSHQAATQHPCGQTGLVIHAISAEKSGKWLSGLLSLLGFLLLGYGFFRINKGLDFPGVWAVAPVLGTVLIIAGGQKSWINSRLLANKFAIWFGLVSFPLYLWHWPLLSFLHIIESGTPSVIARITAVFLSVVLAWLTYRFIERPVRRGGQRKEKVATLILLVVVVGVAGYATYSHDGLVFRASIKTLADNRAELVRTPARDADCLRYVGLSAPLFTYCRFSNMKSSQTIAVIGDSHAHVAYSGISKYLKSKSKNTVVLANSSCPPILGVPILGSTREDEEICNSMIAQLLDVISSKADIKSIFIFMRGPLYFTGIEPLTGDSDVMSGRAVAISEYFSGAQRTIDRLASEGKKVYFVTENPELSRHAEFFVARPFRLVKPDSYVSKAAVERRQKDYLKRVNALHNVTVVNVLPAFCPDNGCVIFDHGKLLYADDDHLSVAGSTFQVERVLAGYLD
jgi:peptidoglycan/LPS O-acetylase OafA/YrhL